MTKGKVGEEDFFEREIEVTNGNNVLKDVFKPDYEKTKELDRATIYVSAEWNRMLRILKKRLRHEGATQQGVNFIRRRLTIAGLQMLYEDNKQAIDKRQVEYDNDLETYNPLSCILAAQPRNIFPREQIRTSVFVKEETLGWIQDLGDMFDLIQYSVIRVAWCYTILKLIDSNYLPTALKPHTKQDIKMFKEYVLRKH